MGKIKYPPELRLKIVLEYLEGNIGYVALSQKYSVASPRNIAKWVAMYNKHGEAGLCTTHGTYDGQFKIYVVEYMHIVIKRDQFEIQRYTDKSSGIIATFSNDESKLTSDVWYTVDAGLLSTPLGPRILLKTGDKVLIYYIDRSGEKADQLGYVSFRDGSGTTGMYVAGSDYTE